MCRHTVSSTPSPMPTPPTNEHGTCMASLHHARRRHTKSCGCGRGGTHARMGLVQPPRSNVVPARCCGRALPDLRSCAAHPMRFSSSYMSATSSATFCFSSAVLLSDGAFFASTLESRSMIMESRRRTFRERAVVLGCWGRCPGAIDPPARRESRAAGGLVHLCEGRYERGTRHCRGMR